MCALPLQAAPATAPETAAKPARFSISGYGLIGNRELKRILRTLELGGKKPRYLGSSFVEDAALILTARVKRDGYLEPRISIRLQLEDGSTIAVQAENLVENPLPRPLRITRAQFRIHRGVLYHFSKLDFAGLQSITPKEAKSYFMETEALLHLKSARIYTADRLRRGLSSLSDTLDRQGYRDAKVEADKIVRDDRNGSVDVHITVRQGPRFFVHSVHEQFFYGRATVPESERTVFPNKPFSRLWQQDFSLALKTNQYHKGFPDTAVELQTLQTNGTGHHFELDLLAKVNSGEQIRIGQVQFEGAKRTRKALVARRVRIQRGELLDPIRVEEGRYRLARLGIFDSVDLDYHPAAEGVRDVLYRLSEGREWDLSLLFGYGSYELLRGGFELQAFNLWGRAHHAELKAIQSFKASSGTFTYTIPEVIGRDVDLFLNATGLRRQEISFTRLEYGGGVGLHKYFQAAATDVSARYNYQILSAQEFRFFQEVATEGLTNPAVGSVLFEIKHDRRDNPLYPHKGYKIFATIETAARYIGGDANFERIEISPSWHQPLGGGRMLSLGFSHGIAQAFGSPANNLPFNRRFFPGGENSIRGYTEGEASPRNSLGQIVGAETYTLGTVELEQAITPSWAVVLFSDSLGFAQHMDHYPCDTGLFSVGVGLRWRSLIGPIRLEYGYNLNPRPQDPSGTLQFSLGFPF